MKNKSSIIDIAKHCLDCNDPTEKVRLTHFYARQWNDGLLTRDTDLSIDATPVAGRPNKPELVQPSKVAKRSINTEEGRRALVHAICHIEFNAINLAWDAIYRFRDMPDDYVTDWLKVADEEAYHFSLLRQRLNDMGGDYGDYEAHNGLWEMACKTDHDVMVRMALVPRVLEARGLDVTPGMMKRLEQAKDVRTVAILAVILRDEIIHVAIGSRWYQYECKKRGLDSESTFMDLLQEYMGGVLRGPFHEEARLQAGFSQQELNMLKKQAGIL